MLEVAWADYNKALFAVHAIFGGVAQVAEQGPHLSLARWLLWGDLGWREGADGHSYGHSVARVVTRNLTRRARS
jgi:hypothetical protein